MARRAGLSFESVVETAGRIADKEGLENLTLGRLALELGVKPPSLYEHVEGLDGLRRALRLRGFQTLGELLTRETVGKSRDVAVRALAAEMRVFVRRNPGLYESTVATAAGDSKEIREAADKVLETLYAVLAGYGIKDKEAVHAARYVRSLLHGFVSLEKSRGFGLPVDLDESFSRLVETLIQDLNRWSRKVGKESEGSKTIE